MQAPGSRTCAEPRFRAATVIRRVTVRYSRLRRPQHRRSLPAARPPLPRGAPWSAPYAAAGSGEAAQRVAPCGWPSCGRILRLAWIRTCAKGCVKGGCKATTTTKPADYGAEMTPLRLFPQAADITCAGRTVVAEVRRIRRCGSSVVEHSLGKGEVESSILSRSTSISRTPSEAEFVLKLYMPAQPSSRTARRQGL